MFLKRKDIISNYKIIASELTKYHTAFYSQEDLTLFEKSEEKEKYLNQFDMIGLPTIEILTFETILGFKQKGNIKGFPKQLFQKLFELLSDLEVKELIILIPRKLDFLEHNKNNYPPIKKSSQKLKKLIGHKSYFEALQIGLKKLENFVEIFFWLTHGGSFNSVMFFDKEERFVFEICKHGNIHWTEFEKEKLIDCDSFSKNWIAITRCEEDNFIAEE